MNQVTLPALDGLDPLGFLATLGTFRLCASELGEDVKLRFDPATARAVVDAGSLRDVDDVVRVVSGVFDTIGDGQIPGLPTDFPPRGEAPDKLRVQADKLRSLPVNLWPSEADSPVLRHWLHALITDLAADDKGRAAITPYLAPSGKMSFSTTFIKNRDEVRQRSSAFREAFVGWRRVPGCTGAYLDHRVLVSSADAVDGRTGGELGVPGATWLALMALPLLPVTAANGLPLAVGWRQFGRRSLLSWPVWSEPLDIDCAGALLSHPAVRSVLDESMQTDSRALRPFGVFAVGRAERKKVRGRNFAGVLTPLPAWILPE